MNERAPFNVLTIRVALLLKNKNKKKLLIAGGGYADIPLIVAAKELGLHVITSGNAANDLGHKYSDEVQLTDYSNPELMLKLAKRLKIDAICASCNDFSALSSAFVAEELGLPGHDSLAVSKIIHHKDAYREFAGKNGIETPFAKGFTTAEAALASSELFKFPVLVKPVDLTGGKGITRVEHSLQLISALHHAFSISKEKRIVVEEFVVGSRHGITSMIRNGKVVFYMIDNEYYFQNQYLVSGASAPSSIPELAVNRLIADIEKVGTLLNLRDGIVHVQFILRGESPVIIEICRRSPGDLYLSLVKYVTGIDYASYIVKFAVGMNCDDLHQVSQLQYVTRHCIMSSAAGFVRKVVYDPSIKNNLLDEYLFWEEGCEIVNPLVEKLGIVFLKFDSELDMVKKTSAMQELIKVHVSKRR